MVIVAAVDRSDRAATVIDEAESLAKGFDEEIHIVHVLSQKDFVNLGRTSVEKSDPVDMEEVKQVAADVASEAVDGLDVPYQTVGLMGQAAPRLVTYAEDQNAQYIVLSGRKRSPTGKALFGSVSQSVLLNAKCPVVSTIHKPEE